MSGVREANRQRIVDLLRVGGPMTQAELARASGLSPATISSIAAELEDGGWLAERDGRRAALALSRTAGVAVGIDFGHSHVRVAVADLGHTVLAEHAAALDVDHDAADGIAVARGLVEGALRQVGVSDARVAGVGMGMPAPLRSDSGEVGDSAILPGWIGTRPEQLMGEALGRPVRADNDANLGALAEVVWGAAAGCTDVVYVKAASGVGAGLVLGGRLYRGDRGTAGELGHLTIDEAGPVCRCGNRGCLETFAGADAVLAPLRLRYGPGFTLRRAIELANAGDRGCRRALADAGRSLGLAVAGVCNLLAPQRVVLGGELAAAGDIVLDAVRAGVRRSAIGAARHTDVVAGVLGPRAEVLGAVALVLRESQRYVAEPGPGPAARAADTVDRP